jgi:hypothetical protein
MSVNLGESPLAEHLRNKEPENNWDGIAATLIQWPENELTDLGRATLAALSLPDPGEPDTDRDRCLSDLVRYAAWETKSYTVEVCEWETQGVAVYCNRRALEFSKAGPGEALALAAALIAAHALAEQWRAEVGD